MNNPLTIEPQFWQFYISRTYSKRISDTYLAEKVCYYQVICQLGHWSGKIHTKCDVDHKTIQYTELSKIFQLHYSIILIDSLRLFSIWANEATHVEIKWSKSWVEKRNKLYIFRKGRNKGEEKSNMSGDNGRNTIDCSHIISSWLHHFNNFVGPNTRWSNQRFMYHVK